MSTIKVIETKVPFSLRQVTVKARGNQECFTLLKSAIAKSPVQLVFTPRIDANKKPYYWIGVRFNSQELDFKLSVNDQITEYIYAYLRGDENLPEVTNYECEELVEDLSKWIEEQEDKFFEQAISVKEEVRMYEECSYLTKKIAFRNGKVIYPSEKVEDVLSLILKD